MMLKLLRHNPLARDISLVLTLKLILLLVLWLAFFRASNDGSPAVATTALFGTAAGVTAADDLAHRPGASR